MGAQLWHHISGPCDSPHDALSEIQSNAVSTYDLPELIRQHLKNARDAVALTAQDDEYGLHDFYCNELARIEKLAALSRPDNDAGKIQLLRQLFESSGEGIGNVLDVTKVADNGGLHVTRPLTVPELVDLAGTDRPTVAECELMLGPINERLSRGESVCFPIYSDDRSTSLGWCFVGNTVD